MKKHVPNTLTCINLIIGCVGIYYTIVAREPHAFYFVIVAGLFDFLDGFVARLLKVQSKLGKQLDSLADLVSFGLLPSFFILELLQEKSEYFWMAIIIVVFSAIRLALFNIDETQTDHFKGLPTPANAIMLTSLIFLPFELYEYTLMSICLFSSLMLVCPVRLITLNFSSITWERNKARWILILGSVILLIVFKWTFIPFLIPFYILTSLLSNITMKKK